MGCTADPRRTAQARHRCRADECSQVHGAAEATALPGLDDFSAQSCRRDRRDGSFRGADDFVPASVWLADPAPRSGLGATAQPTAEWIAHQLTEACGWERAPEYLIDDRDRAYGRYSPGVFGRWASE